jgi:hypothetical protein
MTKLTQVIDKIIQDRLDEQVQHLKSLSEEKDENQIGRSSQEWKLLYDGAKTVIELLSSDLGHKDRLSYFFDGLNLDELKLFRDNLEKRVNTVESEPKITIFGVNVDNIYHGWFTKYPDAKTLLLELVDKEIDVDDEYEFEFGICKKQVFESQVAEYINT